jgi:hypothetical protein
MQHLKAFIALIFGLDELPSTANSIGAVIGLLFIIMMLILSTGAFG